MSKLNYTMCMDWKFTHSDFFSLTPRRGESTQKMKITRKGISHHQVNLGQDPMMANIRLPFGNQDIFLVG